MIVSELIDDARRRLATAVDAQTDEARTESRWIVEEATGWTSSELIAHLADPVTVSQVKRFDEMVARRVGGEPIQYVLGHWPFRGLDLMVDRRVLIPRPETEVLVDVALRELDRGELDRGELDRCELDLGAGVPNTPRRVVDLGTGSGAIAFSIAAERLATEVWAVERSAGALTVARANLAGLGRAATRVRLLAGSWFEPLPPELRGTVDLIVSNPPYIDPADSPDASVVQWEPSEALWGAGDGLGDVLAILEGAPDWLVPGGSVVCEIDAGRADRCGELARSLGYRDVGVEDDLAGLPRVLRCRVP